MTYGELKRRLRQLGIVLRREAARHEVWWNPSTGRRTLIPRHRGEVPRGTLHTILRDLGFTERDLEQR
ncbi:MAG TPA: type II toxin-antitoxin system HicA family toxin [Dehalococcoidia bacterium]|nr:type II toxin-antitoxin system HicA family toxin [Dehalococcoidia bacterium]